MPKPLTSLVTLIDPLPNRRNRLAASDAETEGLELVAAFSNLNEAFNTIAARQPDLVLVANDLTKLPEFTMFADMTRMLGPKLPTLTDDARRPARAPGATSTTAAPAARPWRLAGAVLTSARTRHAQ